MSSAVILFPLHFCILFFVSFHLFIQFIRSHWLPRNNCFLLTNYGWRRICQQKRERERYRDKREFSICSTSIIFVLRSVHVANCCYRFYWYKFLHIFFFLHFKCEQSFRMWSWDGKISIKIWTLSFFFSFSLSRWICCFMHVNISLRLIRKKQKKKKNSVD